ncbi:Rv3654c family TadE-like protein [Lysobacter korlensis]|uniref:Rv3654c family TadE-like protein n=1 Tax=Lysobacter korlensis TaxID=553636 RepID=A0ABV6S1G6_9GAMM
MRWRNDEGGAGSVLALGTVAALAVAITVLLPFALLAPVKHRVKDAADAAALAAADSVVGLAPGAPCELATTVAEGNGASVLRCSVDGLIATITAGVTLLGLPITATSSAGPPAENAPP